MSRHENALRTALLRLNGQNPLPVSAFTPAQRRALEQFGQQTGAVQFLARGSGGSYRISDPAVFALHLRTLSPLAPVPPVSAPFGAAPAHRAPAGEPSPAMGTPPIRAHNIGHRRDSKAGRHAHEAGYVLLKAASHLFLRGNRKAIHPGAPATSSCRHRTASRPDRAHRAPPPTGMTPPETCTCPWPHTPAISGRPACASPRTTTGIPTPPSGSSRTRRSSTAPTGCPRGLPSRCSTTTASSPTCWSAGWQHAHGAAG